MTKSMRIREMLLRVFALMVFSLAAVACGGGGGGGGGSVPAAPAPSGGDGGSTSPPPSSPSPGGDVVRGVITGFGSVFIDGTRFDTSNATFSKDDDEVTEDDLEVGMVVELEADLDDHTASYVKFEEDIKGPIDAVGTDELTVLGQRVLLSAETTLDDDLDIATLVVGDVLEISGLRGVDDVLEASFIELKDGDVSAYKVIGQIRDLDDTAQTFRIGGLVVDYSVAELDDIDTLLEDMTVEVKDESLAYNPGDLSLLASKVEPAGLGKGGLPDDDESGDDGRDEDDDADDREYKIEGLITSVIDDNTFEIGSIVVRHDANTEFEYGDATQLQLGVKVEVEGISGGELADILATEIEFADNSARVDGIVELVNLDEETLVVFGVTVAVAGNTEMEDDESDISLADVMPGDFVEVEGVEVDGRLNASELEVEDEADETSVRGIARDVDAENLSLSILGIGIVTSAGTQYEGFNDEPLTAEEFFEALNDGQTSVEAEWDETVTDPTVPVRELSLED